MLDLGIRGAETPAARRRRMTGGRKGFELEAAVLKVLVEGGEDEASE